MNEYRLDYEKPTVYHQNRPPTYNEVEYSFNAKSDEDAKRTAATHLKGEAVTVDGTEYTPRQVALINVTEPGTEVLVE